MLRFGRALCVAAWLCACARPTASSPASSAPAEAAAADEHAEDTPRPPADDCRQYLRRFGYATPRIEAVTRATPPSLLRSSPSAQRASELPQLTHQLLARLAGEEQQLAAEAFELRGALAATIERADQADYVKVRDQLEALLENQRGVHQKAFALCLRHAPSAASEPSARELALQTALEDGMVGRVDSEPLSDRANENQTAPRSGRLPPELIQAVVRSHFKDFRVCYEAGLTRNPELAGRVTTRFVIDREGRVDSVSVGQRPIPKTDEDAKALRFLERVNGGLPSHVYGNTTLPDEEVLRCIGEMHLELQFPKPEGGIVTVVYPISFSPG